MKKFLLLCCLLAQSAVLCGAENQRIDIPVKNWKAWGNDSIIDIKVLNNEINFRRRKGNDGWNTPMYNFPADKRPVITALTFLSFEYKASRSRKIDININNASEETQYAISLNATAGDWQVAKIHFNSAVYKRGGKAGIAVDGMSGDRLAGFQIAYSGKEITIRNIHIYEADPNDPGMQSRENPAVKEYVKNRQPANYRQLQNGAVFPFGVIHTLRQSDRVNGGFFGQSTDERTMDNLRLIRMTGFNAYANFCEVKAYEISDRLAMAEKYDLHLLETATSAAGLSGLPSDHKVFKEISANAQHPYLLAFYGQDEPTNIPLYLRNKVCIEKNSGNKVPVTSAIHMMSVAREIGAAMDIITIDPYSLNVSSVPGKSLDILASHSTLVQNAMQYCSGKRVWVVNQAFAMRIGGTPTLRFPTAAELRFDVFNMIASGANGCFAFIWQDQSAYLRASSAQGESFDQTLCDPYGNVSDEAKALGDAGRKIVPVMSFFLDRKAVSSPYPVKISGNISIAQWQGEYGNLFIAVNRDLEKSVEGSVTVTLKAGEKLYDLEKLTESNGTLALIAGDGTFLLATTPEKFAALKKNILERKEHDAAVMRKLALNEPAEFQAARKALGNMHRRMMAKIGEFDGNPAMDATRQQIKALAKEYFDALREYRKTGKVPANVAGLPARIDQIL